MPITALNAVPGLVAPRLPDGSNIGAYAATLQAGRAITILVSVLIGLFIFLWGKALYGSKAGLFSLLLFCLEPSIIAHSRLVTTDVYAMGAIALATFGLWNWNQRPTAANLLLAGFLLGLSQIAKYSAVFLVPIFVLIQLLHDLPEIGAAIKAKDGRAFLVYARRRIAAALVMGAAALLVINAAYLLNESLTPLSGYDFQSGLFAALQARSGPLINLPLPLPVPYLQGLDLVTFRDQMGIGFGRIFMLGRLSDTGFPGFYFVDLALKTPLPTLIAIAAGTVVVMHRRPSPARMLENEIFLLVPVVWYLYIMNFQLHAQLGIRLILIIFPFLLILAGPLVKNLDWSDKPWWVGLGVLVAWLAISVISYYPHYISYFNEIVWNRKLSYRYLSDSDLDWGQSRDYLAAWKNRNPEALIDPDSPAPGVIVVSPTLLDGVPRSEDPDFYAWVRDNFDPVETVALTYPVFHIQKEDLERLGYWRSKP
jgi:hypothetical protein